MIKDPPEQRSIWLATFATAPSAAAVVMAAVTATILGASDSETMAIVFAPLLAMAFGVALLHTLLIGLPAYVTLRTRGWANLASAIAVGLAAGVIPIGLLTIWPVIHASDLDAATAARAWSDWGELIAILAANGAAAGAAFWATIRFWPGNRSRQADPEVFA